MIRGTHVNLIWLALVLMPIVCWSKAATTKIEIVGDNLEATIEITDPAIVKMFHIWNGPGARMNGKSYHLDPDKQAGAFIDWPKGMVADRPKGLERYQIAFHIEGRQDFPPEYPREYKVAYEIDRSANLGYVYLPRGPNTAFIVHRVEGNWFYSSEAWERFIRPVIEKALDPSFGS